MKDLISESAMLLHAVEDIPANPQTQSTINQGLYTVLYGILQYLKEQEEAADAAGDDNEMQNSG